jgi:hypothetical protein
MMARLLATIRAGYEEMVAEMRASHEEMTARLDTMIYTMNAKLDAHREEMKAMLDACLEKVEGNPGEMQFEAVHKEVPKKEATVKCSGALKKQHGG